MKVLASPGAPPGTFRFAVTTPAPIAGIDVFYTVFGLDFPGLLRPYCVQPPRVVNGQAFYLCELTPDRARLHFGLRSYGAFGLKAQEDGRLTVYLPRSLEEQARSAMADYTYNWRLATAEGSEVVACDVHTHGAELVVPLSVLGSLGIKIL